MWRPWGQSAASTSNGGGTSISSRTCLDVGGKNIIFNVYTTLTERGMSKKQAVQETASLTKIPYSTVFKIVSNPIVIRRKRKDSGSLRKLDASDVDLVRRKIYDLYKEQIVPTLNILMQRLKKDETGIQCCRETLRRSLLQNGFKFKKLNNSKKVIMESARLKKWRLEYLLNISQFREAGRNIVFLDETWFDTHDIPRKGWIDSSDLCQTNAPNNKGKRITIIHAGTKDGFIPSALSLSAKSIKDSLVDYHDDTTAELFEDWFQNKLLPNISPNSVIVMDNASYHSRRINKAPCSNDKKTTIQEYMLDNDLYFEENYTKKQLLEVLRSYSIKKQYFCDLLAESLGHTVLRLPPYHCMFNPIEQIWHQLKSAVRRNNISPSLSSTVVALIQTEMEKIPDSSWANCVSHVKKVEQSYIDIAKIPKEKIIINLDDDSESETDLYV